MEEKNIYQKLLNIKKQCSYLKKDAEGFKFHYASAEHVYGALNPLLIEQGLFITKDVENVEVVTVANKPTYLVNLLFTITNVDKPTEQVKVKWFGSGENGADKGYGSALTYGLRYFLLSQFDIATGKDDPDAKQAKKPVTEKTNDEVLASINNIDSKEKLIKLDTWLKAHPNFKKVEAIVKAFNIVEIKYSPVKTK